MKRIAILVVATATALAAQMPQFKSQEEVDAFMALQSAATADARAEAGSSFIATFPNSDALSLAAYLVMLSHQQLNDFENMLLYGEMVLEHDPAPSVKVGTLISLASAIPTRTREFDLDKEEKLAKAEDYAKQAMALIPTIAKMDPNMSDDEWLQTKMEFMSQCHEAVGSVAIKREDYEAAEASMRKALDMTPSPQPITMYQLATALSKLGRNDEATNLADRCTAGGGFPAPGPEDLCAKLKAEMAN